MLDNILLKVKNYLNEIYSQQVFFPWITFNKRTVLKELLDGKEREFIYS